MRPADRADDGANADDIDGNRLARSYHLVTFDQRSHRRDVAEPDFRRNAVDGRDRPAHQPLARLANTLIAFGLDTATVGNRPGLFRRHGLAEDIALYLAHSQVTDQVKVVVGLDALRRGVHVQTFGERDDCPDDGAIALGRGSRAANEALVDLDLVEWRLLQIAKR